MSVVYIKKTDKYSHLEDILSEMNPAVSKESIFIKPNVVVPLPAKSAVITNPEAVRVIARYFKKAGFKNIYVGKFRVWMLM